MKISGLFLLLLLLLLSACAPGWTSGTESKSNADLEREAATKVAVALTQTALATMPKPEPVSAITSSPPPEKDNHSLLQKTYQNSALGIQFQYPDSWFEQAPDNQMGEVALSSFDPARPPHKLEWTGLTVTMQFRFLPVENTAQPLEVWVVKAKETAAAGLLSISGAETFQIANQPAVHLILVSGSGGVIHQVLTILDGIKFEILIEGNFSLARAVLDSLVVIPSAGLKPADSDTPAAGICSDAPGDTVRILLGAGSDGLPLAGRCLFIRPGQRILLANGTDTLLNFDFAQFHIDLPAGGQWLLDKPVGEYLALGVHFLPMGPELWVKEVDAAP